MRFIIIVILAATIPLAATAATKEKLPKPFRKCSVESVYDGVGHGFTWKPLGAHWPVAVMVLPERFVNHTRSVGVYNMKGRFIGPMTMKGDGVCAPGQKECVYRPSFKGTLSGQAYRRRYGAIMIKAYSTEGKCYLYPVTRPWQRVD